MTQEIWLQQAGRHGVQTDNEHRLSRVPCEWTVEEHFVVFGRPAAYSDHTLSNPVSSASTSPAEKYLVWAVEGSVVPRCDSTPHDAC